MANKLKEYQRADTMGKSHLDLLIQVYDGAISSFQNARQAYRDQDNQKGYEHLEKGRRFLTHLYTTLDYDQGGEIAENLGKLYTFLISQIEIVQATKDISKLQNSIKVLENLKTGWAGLKNTSGKSKKTNTEKAASENEKQMVFSG
jgi:flagellar protein FliS